GLFLEADGALRREDASAVASAIAPARSLMRLNGENDGRDVAERGERLGGEGKRIDEDGAVRREKRIRIAPAVDAIVVDGKVPEIGGDPADALGLGKRLRHPLWGWDETSSSESPRGHFDDCFRSCDVPK